MSRVPKQVHLVFGLMPDFGGKPWGMVHHCCVMSMVEHIRPERIMIHYGTEPTGPWWELSKPHLMLMKVDPPQEIYGNALLHVAQIADVLRLQVLIEHGGIYLDADVLAVRSFDELLETSVTMGQEGVDATHGMANAVIVAERNAPFLTAWLEEFHWFRSKGRDEYWGEHGVKLPARMAKERPEEINVLGHEAFFWPTWLPPDLRWIYQSNKPIVTQGPGPYAHHLWEAQAWEYLRDLHPGRARVIDTNFHRWIRPYVTDLPALFGVTSAGLARNAAMDARHLIGTVRRRLAGDWS